MGCESESGSVQKTSFDIDDMRAGAFGKRDVAFAVLGMMFFWRFTRYNGIHPLFAAGINAHTGIPNGFYNILIATAILGIASLLFSNAVVRLVRKRGFVLATSSVATVVALAMQFGSWQDGSGAGILAGKAFCELSLSLCFLTLLYGWSMAFSRFFRKSPRATIVIAVASSAVSCIFGLVGSVDAPVVPAIRSLYPILSGVFLILLVRSMTLGGFDEDDGATSREGGVVTSAPLAGVKESISRYPVAWIGLGVFLLLFGSLIKGLLGFRPSSFIDSPELLYSCLATLVEAIAIIAIVVSTNNIRKIAYLSWVVIMVAMAAGFFILGFAGERGTLFSAALAISSCTWIEVFLFVAVLFPERRELTVCAATLFYALPEVISSMARRFVLPEIAWYLDIPLFSFIQSLATALGVLLLAGCCCILVMFGLRGIEREEQPTDATDSADSKEPEVAKLVASEYGLTPRETVVLDYLLRGYGVPSIAKKETLSTSTIHTHCRNIYAKLGVHSRTELIEEAERFGSAK